MDDFEKQEILEEFLVRWNGGTSTKMISIDLTSKGRNPSDVAGCKQIFEKWLDSKKSWAFVNRIRA